MNARELLDDVAAVETEGLEMDLAAVRREVAARDHSEKAVRSRHLFGVIMAGLVAAAVVLLLVVLVPGGVRRASVPATPAPGGLPSAWHTAPEWTPPITRRPMGAASLPDWKDDDGGVTLSADGTRVAWWTASRAGDDLSAPRTPTLPLEVHLLRTADPQVRTVRLPVALPNSMVWSGEEVVVTGRVRDPDGLADRTWRIDGRTGAVRQVCACAEQILGVAPDGHLLRPNLAMTGVVEDGNLGGPGLVDGTVKPVPGTSLVAAAQYWRSQAPADLRGFQSPRLKVAPGGRSTADVVYQAYVGGRYQWAVVLDGYVVLQRGTDLAATRFWSIPSLADEPVLSAKVVDWVRGGVMVQVDTRSGSTLRLLDPATRAVRVVSRGSSVTRPVAVATALVGNAEPHAVPAPDRPWTDRSHLAFLAARNPDVLIGAGVVLVLAVAVPLHRRLRRRRRDRHPRTV